MPFLLLFCCLQTTGPREKPEEEKEDEVEGGAFHGLPQVPLRHIVTKLIISIIYHTRTHTRTHTNKPLDVRELLSSGQTTGAQKGLGVG